MLMTSLWNITSKPVDCTMLSMSYRSVPLPAKNASSRACEAMWDDCRILVHSGDGVDLKNSETEAGSSCLESGRGW